MVLLSVVCPGLIAGVLAWFIARRWPRLDFAAPQLDTSVPAVETELRKHPSLRVLLRREIDPATATGLIVTATLAALLATTVVIGALLLMVQTHSGLAKWDLSFARWGGEHATATSTLWLKRISLLGGTNGVLGITVLIGALEFWRRPNRAIPGLLALAILGQFALVNVIKVVVDRERPAIHQLTGFSGASFPSGHAAAAAVTYAVLALLIGRGRPRWVRNALAGVAVGIAVMVAGSRVTLGVHWSTDVLAGIAVGWAWLAVCSIAFGGRVLKFGAPVAAAEAVAARPSP